jgi:hypothetical protein
MSDSVLDLAALDDAAFDTLYRERIEPLLLAGDAERVGAVRTFRKHATLAAGAAIIAAVAVSVVSDEGAFAFFAGVVVGAIGWFIAYAPLGALRQRVKLAALGAIAEAIGVTYHPMAPEPETLPRLKNLGLAPSHDRSSFSDFFHGERHGCAFDLCEAHLEDERRDKDGDRTWVTVFRGQLLRVSFPKAFLGVTIVRRDAGVFNAFAKKADFQRVGLGDRRFEKAFEVMATDQVEARDLLHPVFMERLLHLEEAFRGKKVRCAFEQGDLLLAVETGDRFELGSIFKPLADKKRARRVVDDIAEVVRLLDAVLTAERAPLLRR